MENFNLGLMGHVLSREQMKKISGGSFSNAFACDTDESCAGKNHGDQCGSPSCLCTYTPSNGMFCQEIPVID